LLSRVRPFVTPWTVAHQAPLSMEFSRQEYCSELPFPSPGDLPDPGIEPTSPALQVNSLPQTRLGAISTAAKALQAAGRTERGQGEPQGSRRAAISLSLAGHSLGAARALPPGQLQLEIK